MATHNEIALLEKAAKYICNTLDGRCPMVAERYACPTACTLDTVPWQCWIAYFRGQQATAEGSEEQAA